MDQTEKQELLNLVNEACSLQTRLYDALSAIEAHTGTIYTNLDSLVQEYGANDYVGMSLNELDEFLGQLEAEE